MANPVAFPNRPFNLRTHAWVISQDIASNQSNIGWQLWVDKTSYSPTLSGGMAARWMKINGAYVHEFYGNGFDFTGAGPFLLASGSTWVAHNADGMKSISIEADAEFDILGATAMLTDTLSPPTIPRASTATFAGGSTFNAGSPVTINTNRADSSFTHNIAWSYGTLNAQTGGLAASTGVGASTTWTPPLSMLAQIPNATSGAGTLIIETRNTAGALVGTKTTAFTLTAAAGVIPTIASLTVSDDNPTVVSNVGLFVQGLSVLKATVNASGVQGSTVTARAFTMGAVTVPSGGTIPVTASGTIPVTAAVTDSRGRVGTWAGSITALPYAQPLFTTALVRRATAAGVLDDNGTSLRVDLNCAVQSLINSTQRNSLTIRVFTRAYGGTTWTARNVINHTAITYNTNFVVSGGANYPVSNSFDVRVEISDKFTTAAAQTVVATADVFMHWSKTGVGVKKYHEQGALDVGGDVYANGVRLLPGATVAETQAGTSDVKAVTPAALAGRTATDARTGIAELATTAEVADGTDAARIVTPAGLRGSGFVQNLARVRTTSGTQSGIAATATAVTGMSVAVTLPAVSVLRFQGQLITAATNADTVLTIRIMDGASTVAEFVLPANSSPVTASTNRSNGFAVEMPAVTAATHTYSLQVLRAAGTGTITLLPSAAYPNWFSIDRVA